MCHAASLVLCFGLFLCRSSFLKKCNPPISKLSLLFVLSFCLVSTKTKKWMRDKAGLDPRWPSNSSQMNPSAFDLFMSKGQWNEFLWHQIPPCRKLEQNLFNLNGRISITQEHRCHDIVPFARSACLCRIRASVPDLIGPGSYCCWLTFDPFNILMEGCVKF